jgi:hypothetical protein
VADGRNGGAHFAFAVPLDETRAGRLETLRLTGPGAPAVAMARAGALRIPGAAPDTVSARPSGGGIAIEWDASTHPMIMVRDPDTGEVLAFARGGRAQVSTGKRALDLVISDGVRSRGMRMSVQGQ